MDEGTDKVHQDTGYGFFPVHKRTGSMGMSKMQKKLFIRQRAVAISTHIFPWQDGYPLVRHKRNIFMRWVSYLLGA